MRGQAVVLGLACAAQFMVVLDVSVVNVALPSIRNAPGFDPVNLQWVASGYALVFAGFLLLGGRLADLYGRRRVFVGGLALFTAASLVGGAAGNLVSGALTQFLSWRWILLINVPIGAIAVLLARRRLPTGHRGDVRHLLDWPGAVLATLGLTALTYGITQAQARGWAAPVTVVALLVGLGALTAFAVVETRFARAPLIRGRRVSSGVRGRTRLSTSHMARCHARLCSARHRTRCPQDRAA